MKKLFSIILIFMVIFLTGCQEKPNKDSSFKIETYLVDMTIYSGVTEVNTYKGTTVYELERCIKEGGSGIFYLGYKNCPYCQSILKYPTDVANELNVTIYYIDAYSQKYPFVHTDGMDLYKELLDGYLIEEDGEPIIYTPHFFTVINGKISQSKISVNDEWDVTLLTSEQIASIKEDYRKMFEPFVDYFNKED